MARQRPRRPDAFDAPLGHDYVWRGDWLRRELDAKGHSQEWLARRVRVSARTVGYWINSTEPKGGKVAAICDALDIDSDQLYERVER